MREVRDKVVLQELGIPGIKVRRAMNGALLMEISGTEAHARADPLRRR